MMSTVLCRVCVKPFPESKLRKMFDEANCPLELATMFCEVAGLEILEDDVGLPKFCCQACSSRLEEAHDIRRLCQESDKKLRKMLSAGVSVKEELNLSGLFEQVMEEPDGAGRKRRTTSENSVKSEEVESEARCPLSDGDNAGFGSHDDSNDPDFVEDAPKRKKKMKPRKSEGGKKLTSKRKRISSRNKKPVESTSADEQPIAQPKKEGKTYQCSKCGKFATSKHSLQEHESTHLPKKPLQCHLCPKAYYHNASLANHIHTHDPNISFSCDQCNNVFKTSNGLKHHLLVHTGDRPFKCQQCPKAYGRQSTLYAHVQKIHYKRKPFKCDLCPKEFSDSYSLKLHRGPAHEGVKLNPCPHCDQNYQSKNYLLQHIAERHPEHMEQVLRCAFCGKGHYTNSHYRKHVVKKHPDRMEEFEILLKQN